MEVLIMVAERYNFFSMESVH